MAIVLLHLASPIDTRKRQSFCNAIIINILQPIEKEPSAGKFNNQNHRLSRWYAPRLQDDNAGSPTRALN